MKPISINRLRPIACAVGLLAAALSSSAAAQSAAPAAERVEVTGSNIKRIDGETPLPVEVIQRADIDKIGVTTAAELLQKITSNVGGLTTRLGIAACVRLRVHRISARPQVGRPLGCRRLQRGES